ncbi:uncharacterized protein C6orf132 [Triticum aestivum]|nr:uncharacterized protein C6orf132-like [Triticum aestivum]
MDPAGAKEDDITALPNDVRGTIISMFHIYDAKDIYTSHIPGWKRLWHESIPLNLDDHDLQKRVWGENLVDLISDILKAPRQPLDPPDPIEACPAATPTHPPLIHPPPSFCNPSPAPQPRLHSASDDRARRCRRRSPAPPPPAAAPPPPPTAVHPHPPPAARGRLRRPRRPGRRDEARRAAAQARLHHHRQAAAADARPHPHRARPLRPPAARTRVSECLVGDPTGTVLFTARNNQRKRPLDPPLARLICSALLATRGQGRHGQPRRMVLASDERRLFDIGTEEEDGHGRRTEHLSSSRFFSLSSLNVCAYAAAHPWSCLSCRLVSSFRRSSSTTTKRHHRSNRETVEGMLYFC